jgi:hypothetical protein
MSALKNVIHGIVLLMLAVTGAFFTLHTLFGPLSFLAALGTVAAFWLWFAAYAGVTTLTVKRFESAPSALLVHGLTLLGLMVLPRIFPLNLLRLGLDLVGVHA